jgi:hydroxyacylglutathione hydrolase
MMTMIVDRIYTPGLAQVAYLVADEARGEAAVIDPRRDVDAYLAWARDRGFSITAILETHVHADFVSGSLELQRETGAPIYASRLGRQDFPHTPLDDGDRIALGGLMLEARWTPGHTPEHMVFLLIDLAQGERPLAMFSGDLLFVGEVGRPDLLGSARTRELAEQLHETFTSRLDDLANDVIVYPGHTAGSSCGKKIGGAPQTTLGQERLFNYALQHRDREAFIEAIMAGMPSPPAYYPRMKVVNKEGAPLMSTLATGDALPVHEVERLLDGGAVLIDARSESSFDRAHITDAFYAGSDPDFVNWVGWLAPYEKQVVLLLDRDEDYSGVVNELRRIGVDDVAGYLEDGIQAWIASGRPVRSSDTISPADLQGEIAQGGRISVLDVRTADEWKSGHIPGAVHRFAGDITTGAEVGLPPSQPIALTCASGYRSRVAASLLGSRGFRNLIQLEGGMDAWKNRGLPVEAA